MPARKPNPVDLTVGRNIRLHRIAAGMSQEALGNEIGVTFQQLQKYEKGANRVGASRLMQIANALGVQIAVLFEGVTATPEGARSDRSLGDLIAEPRAFRLAQAFAGISDAELRRRIVELIERIAAQID